MAIYNDLVLSGKGVSMTISNGDSAYNTLVRNGAKLNISSGGYVETTTVLNSTTISNAGSAVSTFLSGGTMVLSSGAVADTVSVLRNARLTVSSGAVATGLYVSSGNVNAVVKGGDETTLVTGVNEKGEFFLSNGVASNFLMNSLGQLTVSGGGIALNTTIRFGGYLTVMSGGVATGIEQAAGGFVRADVYGGDPNTVACGNNASGEFSLSGGVASNFILYDGGAQQVFSGGTALHTLVSGQRAFQYVWSGGVASNTSIFKNGIAQIYDGGIARDTTVSSGGSMVTNDGALVSGATVMGLLLIDSGSTGEGESGGIATVSDVTVLSGGTLSINKKANFSDISILGTLAISSGISVDDLTVSSGGSAAVAGVFTLAAGSSWNTCVAKTGRVYVGSGATLFNLETVSGARVDFASGAVLAGTSFDIAENTVCCGAAVLGMTASGGVISDLGADGKAYDLTFGSGVTVLGASVADGERLSALNGAVLYETVVSAGGFLVLAAGADTGKRIFFDFAGASGGSVESMVNDLSLISSGAAICLTGFADGGVYTVASGGTDRYVCCDPWGAYDNAVSKGETILNAFGGMIYSFDDDGETVAATALTTEQAPAVLDSAAALNDSGTEIYYDPADPGVYDLSAVWTDFSVSSGAVLHAITEYIEGDAWLKLEGTDLSGAQLFGTDDNLEIDGGMNLYLTSGAKVGALVAGAGSGGAVAGVRLTIDSATLERASYAGGIGRVGHYDPEWVLDDVVTYVKYGVFERDFYAGSLANYAKTETGTDIRDVTLTVDGGSFGGNLYGASAVKAGSSGDTNVHTVHDVNVTLNGGSAEMQKFCLFGGGYATGSTEANVYKVEGSVTIDVNAGSWGSVNGGRGIFGGIFVSGVHASVGEVNISISGGSMGNVYGGGWAQKGGASSVGNVNITVTGGTIANVFGGGSHSDSGGATLAANVTITVSGGEITGGVYARGHIVGDSVTGSAKVIFTGAESFTFADGVYGYNYVGGEDPSTATLNYTDYVGIFSGAIGGFAGITLDGDTAMTLGTAADDVSNAAWNFNTADRSAAFADTAMLNWTAANFTGDTITLNLATGDTNEWSLVTAATDTVYNKFDVQVNGESILSNTIGLNEAITGGAYDGWGFTLEDTTLKFKQLA